MYKNKVLKVSISEFDQAVIAMLKAKENLANLIKDQPQNPNMQDLGNNCFIVKYSRLDQKTLNLSPEYYNFKGQYATIAEKLLISKDLRKDLEEIVKLKSVQVYKNAGVMTMKLHPAVVENLKSLLEDAA